MWRDIPHSNSTSDRLTFEIALYEGSNTVLMQYGTLSGTYADGSSASIGIENSTGTIGIQYTDTGVPGMTSEGLALQFSQSNRYCDRNSNRCPIIDSNTGHFSHRDPDTNATIPPSVTITYRLLLLQFHIHSTFSPTNSPTPTVTATETAF